MCGMNNVFWSTCPTEMLWYSKLKYNQPGVHFCHHHKSSGPLYTFIASILKLLLVLAVLSFHMQEGASLKKDFRPHWKKVLFLSQIVGWNPIVQCSVSFDFIDLQTNWQVSKAFSLKFSEILSCRSGRHVNPSGSILDSERDWVKEKG